MKLQQLRYVLEITRHGNHLSAAAEALNTSQPGVSRQIQLLEAELGFEIFVRTRNRIIGLTPPGQHVVDIARRVIDDVGALRSLKDEMTVGNKGTLSICPAAGDRAVREDVSRRRADPEGRRPRRDLSDGR
jgi:LysR family transcriptional regulator, cys regulon transcriptional activator